MELQKWRAIKKRKCSKKEKKIYELRSDFRQVCLNGFGRIARLVFSKAAARDYIEVVAINDGIDVDYIA